MRTYIVIIGALLVAGCGQGKQSVRSIPTPPNERLVATNEIVNAIKCELAETFAGNAFSKTVGYDEADGKDIKATLNLGEVFSFKGSNEAGIGVDLLGVEVGASGSSARTDTRGQSFKISFDYDLEEGSKVPDFCTTMAQELRVQGQPFVDLLTAIEQEYAQINAGQPRVQLRTVEYTTNFAVEESSTAGGSLNLLIFSFGAERTRSIKTSQSLTLTFKLGATPIKNQILIQNQ